MALLLTLVCGLFFWLGIILFKRSKNKIFLTNLSISCATVVMFGLMFLDLIPELVEIKNNWLILFVMIGFGFLYVLDLFVPHHDHDHHENDEHTKEHQQHIEHISFITIIALLLHNMVEGCALYTVASDSMRSGVLMCLGIGLHNLPFGFQIASYSNKKNNGILLFLLIISGFLGGLLVTLFGSINEMVLAFILALSLGMILHILFFELIKEVFINIKKKETLYGIIVGIIILLIIGIL